VIAENSMRLVRQDVVITCGSDAQCRVRASYVLENAAPSPAVVVGAFFDHTFAQIRPARVTFDGRDVKAVIEDDTKVALAERLEPDAPSGRPCPEGRPPRADLGFRFPTAARHTGTLVFEYALASAEDFGPWDYPGGDKLILSPILVRHLVLYDPAHGARGRRFWLPTGVPGMLGAAEKIDVSVVLPRELGFEAEGGWVQAVEAGRRIGRRTFEADRADAIAFTIHDPPTGDGFFAGPVMAIGSNVDRPGFRMRGGVEFTRPAKFAVYSFDLDTNLKDYLVAAVTAEVGAPSAVLVWPSIAGGVGLPIRIERDLPVRVGVRFQATLSWYLFGLVLPIDYYPAADLTGRRADASLMFRVSL
jgi:hypothetical protein